MTESAGSAAVPPQPPERDRTAAGPPIFTVAQATRMLPYLRSTIGSLHAHLSAMRGLREDMRRMEAIGRAPKGELILAADHDALLRLLAGHHAECERLLQDIADRGCQIKDLAAGLCDFPAVIAGRTALLCWRIDEPAIAFYHDERDGFAGRRPLPSDTD